MDTKKKVLYVRMNEKQADEIYKKIVRCGMTINQYVLRSCLEKQIVEVPNAKILAEQEVVKQLKYIGNNLNQLARLCHEKKALPQIHEITDIKEAMDHIWQFLKLESQVNH